MGSFLVGAASNEVCEDAERMVEAALERRGQAIRALLRRCESPVEQIAMVAIWDRWDCRVSDNGAGLSSWLESSGFADPPRRVAVEPQKNVVAAGSRYRADLFISMPRASGGIEDFPIVVEVDGHDWHERTRKQAARDKKRDRDMVGQGMRVLRFTGGEVTQRPSQCVDEIRALLG